jgi:peptidoglycan L-alanyl-D-glutamate endopeptidase CwlK
MPHFGHRSSANLEQCDRRLQVVLRKAIIHEDFSIIKGHRTHEEQQKVYDEGKSNARPGQSPHNHSPSLAFDFVPWPFNNLWTSARFDYLAGLFIGVGIGLGISLEWGGNFKSIMDKPHIQITAWKKEIDNG